jgi:hypothetical protein
MGAELERTWKEAAVFYFKTLSWNWSARNVESHEELQERMSVSLP